MERNENPTPQIIADLNEYLKVESSEGTESFTVEVIATKIGISKNALYDWVKTDSAFSNTLEKFRKA